MLKKVNQPTVVKVALKKNVFMKYIWLENSVQVVYQKNIIITLSFAINEPGRKTSRVFQKQNFQYNK